MPEEAAPVSAKPAGHSSSVSLWYGSRSSSCSSLSMFFTRQWLHPTRSNRFITLPLALRGSGSLRQAIVSGTL